MKINNEKMTKRIIAALMITATILTMMGCSAENKNSASDITGSYVMNYEEEIGGDVISISNEIILKVDKTCEYTAQDTISGKWTDTEIILDNGNKYEYTIEGNELTINIDGMEMVFVKNL